MGTVYYCRLLYFIFTQFTQNDCYVWKTYFYANAFDKNYQCIALCYMLLACSNIFDIYNIIISTTGI